MSQKQRTILIREDAFIRESDLEKLLTNAGFRVVTIQATDNAIDPIVDTAPDIIITDFDLSTEDDSFNFLATIKNDKRLQKSELFILSEEIDVRSEIALRKLKIFSFFLKAPNIEAVVSAAQQHFEEVVEQDYDQWRESMFASERHDEPAPASRAPQPAAPPPAHTVPTPETKADDDFDGFLDDLNAGTEKAGESRTTTDENSPEAIFERGVALSENGEFGKAAETFMLLIENPEWANRALLATGEAWRDAGDDLKAIELFQRGYKAASDGEWRIRFLYETGCELHGMGKLTEAYRALGAVYKADKDYRDVKKHLLAIKKAVQP